MCQRAHIISPEVEVVMNQEVPVEVVSEQVVEYVEQQLEVSAEVVPVEVPVVSFEVRSLVHCFLRDPLRSMSAIHDAPTVIASNPLRHVLC